MQPDNGDRKSWFRPHRVGWGYSPQTWQGWLVTLILAVAIVVLAILLSRH